MWSWNRILNSVANEVASEAAIKEDALKKQHNKEQQEVAAVATAVHAELDALWKGELVACTQPTRKMTRGNQAAAAMAKAAAAKERLAQYGQARGLGLQVRHLPSNTFPYLRPTLAQPFYPIQGSHQEERQRRCETSALNPQSCSAESAHTDRMQKLRQKAVKLVGNFSDRTRGLSRSALSPQEASPAARTSPGPWHANSNPRTMPSMV